MRRCLLLLAVLFLSAPGTAAPVEGRVVTEAGGVPPGLAIRIDGAAASVDADGRFRAEADGRIVRIEITAAGHYPAVHTVAAAAGRLPDITLVAKRPDRRLLLFAGDAMLARRYFEPLEGEPVLVRRERVAEDGARLLDAVRPYVDIADYASVNLETQLAATQPGERLPKSVTFFSPPELAGLLRDAGFDYVALGNNHLFDYGDNGLKSTLDAVRAAGLEASGAGADEVAARAPLRVSLDRKPYAFWSYVGWAGSFEPNQVAGADKGGAALGSPAAIAGDLATADGVRVVQYHGGLEYAEAPALSERTVLRLAVDEGADVVIGHHPHVLQGLEIYRDRLIAYSMGNFLFDQYHYATHLGMLLYVWMDGERLHRAEAVPIHVNGYVPTPATGAMRYAVLSRLARLSAAFGTCFEVSGAHAIVTVPVPAERCEPRTMASGDVPATGIVDLADLGASPLRPVAASADRWLRLGEDILRRGDFEYTGLFETTDRSWIESDGVDITGPPGFAMEINVPRGGGPVTGGMRFFERVFRPSNPATLSGRLHVGGEARVRFLLQRRRPDVPLSEARASGPITELGVVETADPGWTGFAFDFDQPRVATRSVRLLIEVTDASADRRGVSVTLDDLDWIEWQTPWLQGGSLAETAMHATHLQYRDELPTVGN